jgi:hypothetical protein
MYDARVHELSALVKEHSLHSEDTVVGTNLVSESHDQAEICAGCKSGLGTNLSDGLSSKAS